jgi:hypothetical protein
MKVTLSQAADMTGKSVTSLRKAIKDGVISASRQGNNKNSAFQIDVSELLRVFPEKNTVKLSLEKGSAATIFSSENSLNQGDAVELAVLRERMRHHEQRIQDLKDQLYEAKQQAEDFKQRFLESDTKLLGVLQTITPTSVTKNTKYSDQLDEQNNKTLAIDSLEVNQKKPFRLSSIYRCDPDPRASANKIADYIKKTEEPLLDYPEHEEAVVENICVAVSDDKVTAVDNKIPEKQTEFQKNIQSKIDELRRILDRVRE